MARYPTDHRAETRERILEASDRLLKQRGAGRSSIAEVMQAAGLTVGGFYAHFESKRALEDATILYGLGASMLDRQVALKLPHVSWGIASFAERMARERNILASLTHPNIARLYDAGIAADGRPFLALEYVDGQPINAYAAAAGLSVRACVELSVQVARAVAYAHAHLVVHRDLKPSNILIVPR